MAYPIPGMGGASAHAPPPPPPTTAQAPPTATEDSSIQGVYKYLSIFFCECEVLTVPIYMCMHCKF